MGRDETKNQQNNEENIDLEIKDGFLDLLYESESVSGNNNVDNLEQTQISRNLETSRDSLSDRENRLYSNENWSDFRICRSILLAISDLEFTRPTIIQSRVIPIALEGKDILATAETGSGKTAAFIIPMLQRLVLSNVLTPKNGKFGFRNSTKDVTKALVLLPTRELAAQCYDVLKALTRFLNINDILLTGGIPIKEQETKLSRIPNVIISTPGRALDILLNSGRIHLDSVEIVILDEADRLLEMGFRDECVNILKFCNKNRQTMLFSATLTEETKDLVNLSLVNPIYIKMEESTKVSKTLNFEAIMIPSDELREACVLYLCETQCKSKCILFFQTKKSAHRMALIFKLLNMSCGELHGDLSQLKRFESVQKFRNGEVDYLLASELAARGLDIPGIDTVINVHLPTDVVRYIHRVGRTARMGSHGKAISVYIEEEKAKMKVLLKKTSNIDKNLGKYKRRVPLGVLKKYSEKIEAFEDQINEILINERIEKEIRLCDNSLKSAKDDNATGKRQWFRSLKDKKIASKIEFAETKQKTANYIADEHKSKVNTNKKAVKKNNKSKKK
ncbi:DEAD box ATP-dependent RNA helicase family member protein [Theileria equi strain WA]|uniref:DEAD box ATP-dependent RNA helicase family member protein n=1 Tax=Theileria equi strain WA TaxID=1537102 RepID=L0B176_THEEQ|nr:DEAD box ATP-dependent RNA helicase family member protein [Theileria equi strain WA]AFZ81617.1 DEAD box ATP-dependent RNA helicase family member protein [Theileria equi strain WA]|eukprot:XP_004831283.1 DEAD box ATP-dependent RNA helicase family member protein [Theileria equi strain WA]